MKEQYELRALLFAEKYGIIEYEVKGNMMLWLESYPNEGSFLHQLNLDSNIETSTQTASPFYN